MRRALVLAAAAGLAMPGAAGCERDVEPDLCPSASAGDLVVTEIAPGKDGWVELYNASGGPLDLYGLHLVMRRLDGSDQPVIIVRSTLPVAAAGYVVLGGSLLAPPPPPLDYNWFPDFSSEASPRAAFDSGVIDLEACGVRVDRLVYYDLPPEGSTHSFGGAPPTADGNDDPDAWCTDPGSPGQANPACP